MKPFAISLSLTLAVIAVPTAAVSGGRLGTLDRGTWECERPGDAAVAAGVPVPGAGFEITNDSTYRVPEGHGTYLRTGDNVRMTSGPRKGDRYVVRNEHFLRKVDENGNETGLRCIKLGAAGSLITPSSAPCDADNKQAAKEPGKNEPSLARACGDDANKS